jgi:hypothetical protein
MYLNTNSIPCSKLSLIKTIHLRCREKQSLFFFPEVHIEKNITLCGENVEFSDDKPGGTQSNCHGWFQASAKS